MSVLHQGGNKQARERGGNREKRVREEREERPGGVQRAVEREREREADRVVTSDRDTAPPRTADAGAGTDAPPRDRPSRSSLAFVHGDEPAQSRPRRRARESGPRRTSRPSPRRRFRDLFARAPRTPSHALAPSRAPALPTEDGHVVGRHAPADRGDAALENLVAAGLARRLERRHHPRRLLPVVVVEPFVVAGNHGHLGQSAHSARSGGRHGRPRRHGHTGHHLGQRRHRGGVPSECNAAAAAARGRGARGGGGETPGRCEGGGRAGCVTRTTTRSRDCVPTCTQQPGEAVTGAGPSLARTRSRRSPPPPTGEASPARTLHPLCETAARRRERAHPGCASSLCPRPPRRRPRLLPPSARASLRQLYADPHPRHRRRATRLGGSRSRRAESSLRREGIRCGARESRASRLRPRATHRVPLGAPRSGAPTAREETRRRPSQPPPTRGCASQPRPRRCQSRRRPRRRFQVGDR